MTITAEKIMSNLFPAAEKPEKLEAVAVRPSPFATDRRSARDIPEEDIPLSWLVGGVLAHDTFGVLAGAKKSLKSYIGLSLIVSVASGKPFLGQFNVPEARAVLAYVGEGGRRPFEKRLRRVCRAYGVDVQDLDIEYRNGALPGLSLAFQETLARDLEEIRPAFVNIDPLYAFHGSEIKAGLLNERAALLTALSEPCVEAGAVLLINDHFNSTGSGFDLDRITGAGVAEWADTWMLVQHREAPNVEAGEFRLAMEIGSRQWGGSAWDLDFNVGRFDAEMGQHVGEISWHLNRPLPGSGSKCNRARDSILDVLADEPWCRTKSEVKTVVGGSRDAFDAAWNELNRENGIVCERLPHSENGVKKTRDLWAPAGTPRP